MKHETMKEYELKKWNYEKVWNKFMNYKIIMNYNMERLWNDYEMHYAIGNDYEIIICIDY